MTTVNTQLQRLSKSLMLIDEKHHPSIVPPQLLLGTKGVLFFKKLPRGKQSTSTSTGIYFQRNGEKEWSQPLAVHMNKGDLYWGQSPKVDRVDVMVFIQDIELANKMRCFGQIGFHTDSPNRMKKGCCIENNEASFIKFTTVLSERADLTEGAAFSYGLNNGFFFPVDIESPIVQLRDSSNIKFYNYEKNIDINKILQGPKLSLDGEKTSLIKSAHLMIRKYFDIESRFPAYAGLVDTSTNFYNANAVNDGSEASSPSSESSYGLQSPDYSTSGNESCVGSPNPLKDNSPIYPNGGNYRVPHLNPSRPYSSSTSTYLSTGSDDVGDPSFEGYIPSQSDYDISKLNIEHEYITNDMSGSMHKDDRIKIHHIRQRSSSFDFDN